MSTDKERADAMRVEAVTLEAEGNALNDELSALHEEATTYMAEVRERQQMFRLTIDDKFIRARKLAAGADVLDPDPDAKHAKLL